jgi:predicted HTH transcriptional regulator
MNTFSETTLKNAYATANGITDYTTISSLGIDDYLNDAKTLEYIEKNGNKEQKAALKYRQGRA